MSQIDAFARTCLSLAIVIFTSVFMASYMSIPFDVHTVILALLVFVLYKIYQMEKPDA